MMSLIFSIIVPVYSRPEEMEELLCSLSRQSDKDFEVVVMEGAGGRSCEDICRRYADLLDIHFFCRDTDRSTRRNEGMRLAKGNYFILFDSDCIIPEDYISLLRRALTKEYVDCYGGPDSADASFSTLQAAVNYSMTSLLTTGGIRGKMRDKTKYLPRAFNMGFSRAVFESTGGYRQMIGEDVDLSMRIKEAGFAVRLISEVFVYHKRRVTLGSFFRQVRTFGRARVLLAELHPHSLKLTHLFPSCFLLGNIALCLLGVLHSWWWLLPIAVYVFLLFAESLWRNKRLSVALLSVVTSYIQLSGYGWGFIEESITHKARRAAAETMYRQ